MALKARLDELGDSTSSVRLRESRMKIGINGMGRMGRLALRAAIGRHASGRATTRARRNRLDVVHVNEVKGGAAATAHLLEFDSIHGRWRTSFERRRRERHRGRRQAHRILSASASPGEVPWGDLGCDIVLECTGKFLKPEQLQAYFDRGVKRVIVAAPVKDERALNIVVGVNDQLYDPERASPADRRILHHELPGARRQGRA